MMIIRMCEDLGHIAKQPPTGRMYEWRGDWTTPLRVIWSAGSSTRQRVLPKFQTSLPPVKLTDIISNLKETIDWESHLISWLPVSPLTWPSPECVPGCTELGVTLSFLSNSFIWSSQQSVINSHPEDSFPLLLPTTNAFQVPGIHQGWEIEQIPTQLVRLCYKLNRLPNRIWDAAKKKLYRELCFLTQEPPATGGSWSTGVWRTLAQREE